MSLRLFAALKPSDGVRARLVALMRGVAGAAWRPPENLHLTLRFFGEIDERLAHDLDDELAAVRVEPFDIVVAGAGWFGGASPTSLWMGVEENAALRALAGGCERAARRVGLPPERRPFTPHITVAYCRGTGPDDAARFAQRHGLFRAEPFLADRFALYSSWLGKGPSRYVSEAEYPLAA